MPGRRGHSARCGQYGLPGHPRLMVCLPLICIALGVQKARTDISHRPDTEDAFNTDLAALEKAVPKNKDAVYAITVGSETLYRGNFTGPELLQRINKVGDSPALKGIKIGTADSWNKYADGTADALITGGVKLL